MPWFAKEESVQIVGGLKDGGRQNRNAMIIPGLKRKRKCTKKLLDEIGISSNMQPVDDMGMREQRVKSSHECRLVRRRCDSEKLQ